MNCYCDNAATTLIKPPEVADALVFALANFGAAGRAAHGASLIAGREVVRTRELIAAMVGADGASSVAFTSSATEALNLVIHGLIGSNDRVVTSAAEHNSVLRPLYLTGCSLGVINCDEHGVIDLDHAHRLISPGGVKLLAVTHGSNVTGSITDVYALREMCTRYGVIMLLDVSQTLGVIPVRTDMADVLCFTGHKGLFGPQGTGGVIVNPEFMEKACFNIVKTGGSGSNTFDKTQPERIPDIFESGTQNAHSIYGLQKGVEFINNIGFDAVSAHNTRLTMNFLDRLYSLKRVQIYGEGQGSPRLPIVSINIDGFEASDVAATLWEEQGIAVRAGFHCAPLMHKAIGTESTGAVRFSFSYFNSEDDIDRCVDAVERIV